MLASDTSGAAPAMKRTSGLRNANSHNWIAAAQELKVGQMKLTIPDLSLVVLIGASGSGKSSFARRHFRPTEVISSDACRGLVADDENDQSASADAFAVLHFIAAKRLERGRLTVVDATNVE